MQKIKHISVYSILILSSVFLFVFFVLGTSAQEQGFLNRSHAKEHISVCGPAEKDGVKCHARVIVDKNHNPITQSTPVGYGPAQFNTAYNLSGKAASDLGPIIAIVDAYDDPNIQSDLNVYSAAMGIQPLPSCKTAIKDSSIPCFQKVNQSGKTSSYPRANSSWALEISLDVEISHAICQNCRVLLVEANSASYNDLLAAIDTATKLGASAVSGSWGSSEFKGETSYDSHFNKLGIAFTFSAGDGGYQTSYPAASQYVTAVGGTSLYLNQNNSYQSESVWSGTGSGCSAYESKPSWQNDSLCLKRTMNDVSADADPNTGAAVYDSVSYMGRRGWFQVGGTSLSAPLIAGVYAQSVISAGVMENSLPYFSGSPNLHDITIGANGTCGGTYFCAAGTGYDAPTGLGTPNGSAAF